MTARSDSIIHASFLAGLGHFNTDGTATTQNATSTVIAARPLQRRGTLAVAGLPDVASSGFAGFMFPEGKSGFRLRAINIGAMFVAINEHPVYVAGTNATLAQLFFPDAVMSIRGATTKFIAPNALASDDRFSIPLVDNLNPYCPGIQHLDVPISDEIKSIGIVTHGQPIDWTTVAAHLPGVTRFQNLVNAPYWNLGITLMIDNPNA